MKLKEIVSQLLIFSFVISHASAFALPEKGSDLTAAQVKELQNQLTLLKADKSLSDTKIESIESLEKQIEKLIKNNEKLKKEVEKLKSKNEKLKKKVEESSTDSNTIVDAADKIINAYFWDKYGPALFAGGFLTASFAIALLAFIFDR